MLKLTVFCFVIAFVVFTATGNTDNMLGKGRWFVINIAVCADDERYEHRFNIQRKKVNRTHDGFNAFMNLTTELNDEFGIRIELCKHCDGGCKPYQIITDDSLVGFIEKYAKSNAENCLKMAGIENGQFPMSPGLYEILDFIFDYCELPPEGVYGVFEAIAYILKGDKEVACVQFTVEFRDVDAKCGEPDSKEE